VVLVLYFLARRVRTDQRWDSGVKACGGLPGIALGKGARSTSTRAPGVKRTHLGGRSLTPSARRTAAARGAARYGGADFILVAAEKTMYGGIL
jgi:hypothetical protein